MKNENKKNTVERINQITGKKYKMRITEQHLDSLINRLNQITGENPKAYDTTKTKNRANIGTYILDCAYGGYQLARIHNASGGQSQPLGGGYQSKRETYEKIIAFISGFEAAKEAKK